MKNERAGIKLSKRGRGGKRGRGRGRGRGKRDKGLSRESELDISDISNSQPEDNNESDEQTKNIPKNIFNNMNINLPPDTYKYINTSTTLLNKKINKNKVKRKKTKAARKKDEENILSKDIDVEEEMKELERMNESRGLKPRDISNINYSKSYLKNLKFRPQKYKGNYLPYHLRWIFGNSVKSNEIALIQEIEALENEINRLKQMKLMNREFRKIAEFPIGLNTSLCPCCKKVEKKKHDCTHEFCEPECLKKKAEIEAVNKEKNIFPHSNLPPQLRKKMALGVKPQIFGLVERSKDTELASNLDKDKKPFFIVKK